jgi:hypothetical protein
VLSPAALLAVALLGGCVFIPFVPPSAQPEGPDVQDFVFESFDASYELGRDEQGVATLTTTERLVALFPEYDQNRGIHRLLIDDVDGQHTGLEVVAVTDGAGDPIEFEVQDDGRMVSIVMAGDEFVHGRQEYVVVYTQRNVISDVDGVESFHWSANGTGWSQPFGRVSARVELAGEIAEGLESDPGCYVDSTLEQRQCDLDRDENVVSATVEDLGPGESLTLHLEFADLFEVE